MVKELVDFALRNKKRLFNFNVNFEKAFDSISWDNLLFVLKQINFGSRGIKWIQTCFFPAPFQF